MCRKVVMAEDGGRKDRDQVIPPEADLRLFQGRYKAIFVDIDKYAKELSRYIHFHPVK